MFRAMGSALRLDYANSVSKTIKVQRSLLKERTRLTRDEARIERLAGDAQAEAKEALKARRGDLATRETALYVLRPRT